MNNYILLLWILLAMMYIFIYVNGFVNAMANIQKVIIHVSQNSSSENKESGSVSWSMGCWGGLM